MYGMVLGIQGICAFLPLKARTWNGGTYGTDHSDQECNKTFIGKDNQVEALKGISLDINKGRHLRHHRYEWCRKIYPGTLPELSGEAHHGNRSRRRSGSFDTD